MVTFTVRYDATVEAKVVTHRVIFNPNYGGKGCVVPGTCVIPIRERKIKPQFFKALRSNVERDGFRNPILLYNTHEGLLLSFGGSRLRVAKELDVRVPAIIVDYTGNYQLFQEVTSSNWQGFFKDVPVLFDFTEVGVVTHYSLERNRRDKYDEAGMEWTNSVEDTQFLDEEFPWLTN